MLVVDGVADEGHKQPGLVRALPLSSSHLP